MKAATKIHRTLAALSLAVSLAGAAQAQAVPGLDGRWEGSLDAGAAVLKIVFRVETTAGATTLLLDSPDQGASGIPTADLKRDGQKVSFEVPTIAGGYSGTLSADGKSIEGSWSQNGMSLPLAMTKK